MQPFKTNTFTSLVNAAVLLLATFITGCTGPVTAPRTVNDVSNHHFILTDTSTNTRAGNFMLTSSEINASGPAWSVAKEILHGGKQENVDLITINNGKLIIRIIPTRGMGIYDVCDSKTGKRIFGWESPVKEIVHPNLVDLESRGGLGWLEGFNEWMVRCGLSFAGHPGQDEFVNNTGDTATMDLTLHGKVQNIPASKVEILVEKNAPHRIVVRGTVYENMFYGPKLKLVAELSTVPGSDTFRLSDTITNNGAFDEEFQIIYHTNFGAPLLEKGATVEAAAKSVAPMNAHAGKAAASWATYAGPTKGFIEEVFLIEPYAKDGKTAVLLKNAAGDRGAKMSWPVKQLPYLTIWKNTVAKESGYVTGIEPGTGFPFNRKVERHFGRVPKLKPGQSREFTIDYTALSSVDQVNAASKSIKAIQNNQPTNVKNTPPKLPD